MLSSACSVFTKLAVFFMFAVAAGAAGCSGGGGHTAGSAALQGVFVATGSMAVPRANHRATLLPNGKVFIVGGFDSLGECLASAELYDPAAGTFVETGSMTTPRVGHTVTLLPTGKVLIAGGGYGIPGALTPLASAELYDPASGRFAETVGMTMARGGHSATLLPSGKLLIAGGNFGIVDAELYDPVAGTSAATGNMNGKRDAQRGVGQAGAQATAGVARIYVLARGQVGAGSDTVA